MADRLGHQLGTYRLTQLLGTGGFAEVYLGEHIHLGTKAAVKLLHTQLATVAEGEKFRQEARIIATLGHPNIVRVLDFDVEEGTPYLVMEYAPQGSLRQLLPAGVPLPPDRIVLYLVQVAEALQYAHEQKLVHRDIKPENMLLGRRNEVLLSDFGIATVAQSTSQQKTEGVAGTTAYMSPEQLQGKPRSASDLYSLGVVIYEWLAGERPFQGSFVEVATQHLFTLPPPLREKVPTLSEEIEQVVLTALAKDPTERFGSVRAFATAFVQASGAGATLASFVTHLAPPSTEPSGLSGIAVSAESQLTPRVTPQLSNPLAADSPLQPPAVPGAAPIGKPGPSLFSATTQVPPATPASPQPQSNQPGPSLRYAQTQLTPPTADKALPQGSTSPSLAPGPAGSASEGSSVTFLPPGWGTPSTPPDAHPTSGNQTTMAGLALVPGAALEGGGTGKRGRRLAVIVLVTVLALVLVGGGAAYVLSSGLLSLGTTTVTITPQSSLLKNTFHLTGVTSPPDASQMQVEARQVSVTTPSQSKTVPATGQQTISGTHPYGQTIVSNSDPSQVLTIAAGASYPNMGGTCWPSDVTLVLDASVDLPPAPGPLTESSTTIPAHLVQFGPLPPRDSSCSSAQPDFVWDGNPNQRCVGPGGGTACTQIVAQGDGWTDGTNPQTVTVVAQSDIDTAANSLIQANQSTAQQALQAQLRSNERLAGMNQCQPTTSQDHNAGDVANQVTITVTFTCTGEAYDYAGALTLVTNALRKPATNTPGSGYALVGTIKTTLVSATPGNQGTVAIMVNAEGIWAYQISPSQQQALARLIAGKSKQDALTVLAAQPGIAQVDIQIASGGQTLPSDPTQITVHVQAIAGV